MTTQAKTAQKAGKPLVTPDVRVPLSVTFEAIGDRINFVLEERSDERGKHGPFTHGKYELYRTDE
jgi:hypothetical protein